MVFVCLLVCFLFVWLVGWVFFLFVWISNFQDWITFAMTPISIISVVVHMKSKRVNERASEREREREMGGGGGRGGGTS